MLLIMSSLCVLSARSQCLELHWHLPTHRHTAAAALNIHFYRPCSQHHLDMTRKKTKFCQFTNQGIFLHHYIWPNITRVRTDNALSKYRNAISNDPFFISWADCSNLHSLVMNPSVPCPPRRVDEDRIKIHPRAMRWRSGRAERRSPFADRKFSD